MWSYYDVNYCQKDPPGTCVLTHAPSSVQSNKNKVLICMCFNWNYNHPCDTTPCHYKHERIKCFSEEHAFMDCPKRLKRDGPKKIMAVEGTYGWGGHR